MDKQNIKEYELMRVELLSIKSCITTYMGYMLSGAGASLVGMAAMSKNANSWFIVYASASVTIVMLLVLLIIFYKFNSHNRFAAYCKVLSQEILNQNEQDEKPDDSISWELCIQQLRDSDADSQLLIDQIRNIDIVGIDRDQLIQCLSRVCGLNPPIDNDRYRRGFQLLIATLMSHPSGKVSWAFPVYVSTVFFVLTSIFSILFVWHSWSLLWDTNVIQSDKFILLITFLPYIGFTSYMWFRLSGKLYTLVYGSATIMGYFIRFLSSRAYILASNEVRPRYFLTSSELDSFCRR